MTAEACPESSRPSWPRPDCKSAYLDARAASQSGTMRSPSPVPRKELSAHRKEDLRDMRVGTYTDRGDWVGWEVKEEGRASGTWDAEHSCGMRQDIVLDAQTIYAPRCKSCGIGAPGCSVKAARERHRAGGAFYVGKYPYRIR